MTQYAIDERKAIGQNYDPFFIIFLHVYSRLYFYLCTALVSYLCNKGENMTIPDETLKSIHPTLKKENKTKATPNASANLSKSSKPASTKPENGTKPKKAKKEDCVYEVNNDNFQKIVLESPVPVLLDIYADC